MVKNPPNHLQNTPLHWAAGSGHLDVCKLIIKNVHVKDFVNNDGKTPKDMVDKLRHPELYQLLHNREAHQVFLETSSL